MRRPLVLAAVAAGLAAGTVIAATRPDDAAPQSASNRLPPITAAPARPIPGRLPDGRYDPSYSHFLLHSDVRIVATVDDPHGEPAWAIRTYTGERRTIKKPARTLDDYAFRQAYRCVQVGRLMDGRFGWVYGDRHFRPTRPGIQDELTACTSRKRPQEVHFHQTTVAFTAASDPRLVQGILWGFAPPGATAVTIIGEPGGDRAVTLHGRAYLALIDPALPRGALRLRFAFADGRTDITRVDRAPRPFRIAGVGEPIPGSETVEARAPDPAGGPPWGVLVADRRGGGTCVTSGAVQTVGAQAGGIDADLGLFSAAVSQPVPCRRASDGGPTRGKPLWYSYGGGSGPDDPQDPFLRRARIERRVQTGQFELVSECHPDVESVTLQSPRDIRTLVPSERGHVILAVYDGSFPAGELLLTAHMHDGSTKRERIELGWF
jgi:hypothetical protein